VVRPERAPIWSRVEAAADLEARIKEHDEGTGSSYTSKRLPVTLEYSEEYPTMSDAMWRERQIKRWSGQKKAALVSGDVQTLKALAKRRRPKNKGS
jgi:putative endonuclease